MVSFYFPEYFVGKVSAEGLISVRGASYNLARRYACPHTRSSASGLHLQRQPPPSHRGAPALPVCQRASAMTSSACGPAPALLADICPSSMSIHAALPLELLLERYQPPPPRGGDGGCEMAWGKGNNPSPFWPCRRRGAVDLRPVHLPAHWGYP